MSRRGTDLRLLNKLLFFGPLCLCRGVSPLSGWVLVARNLCQFRSTGSVEGCISDFVGENPFLKLVDEFLGLALEFFGLDVDETALLIVLLAVGPNQLQVVEKGLVGLVLVLLQVLPESLEVHGAFDDLGVVQEAQRLPRDRPMELA